MLAAWGIAVVGTVFAALTVNPLLREMILPMLLYPVLIPRLMAAMQLTTPQIAGTPVAGDLLAWVRLLIGFDIVFTALSLLLVDTVLIG